MFSLDNMDEDIFGPICRSPDTTQEDLITLQDENVPEEEEEGEYSNDMAVGDGNSVETPTVDDANEGSEDMDKSEDVESEEEEEWKKEQSEESEDEEERGSSRKGKSAGAEKEKKKKTLGKNTKLVGRMRGYKTKRRVFRAQMVPGLTHPSVLPIIEECNDAALVKRWVQFTWSNFNDITTAMADGSLNTETGIRVVKRLMTVSHSLAGVIDAELEAAGLFTFKDMGTWYYERNNLTAARLSKGKKSSPVKVLQGVLAKWYTQFYCVVNGHLAAGK